MARFLKSWDLQIDSAVVKALNKIPRRDAEAISKALGLLLANPYQGDIQKNERRRKFLEEESKVISYILQSYGNSSNYIGI